jgi:hypothetical protein
MKSQADILTNTYMPILKEISGGGYAYMNEVGKMISQTQAETNMSSTG